MEPVKTDSDPMLRPPCGDSTALRPQLNYKALSTDFPEIRLLTLHASTDEESPIQCTLKHANLDDGPEYAALSYVWGDATITDDILVNGIPFSATMNLFSALRHIRKLDGEIVIWVDAICIDQANISERGRQVQLMKFVYTMARKVIAWLGPDYAGASASLQMLERIFDAVHQYPDNFEWLRSIPELCVDSTVDKDEFDPGLINTHWEGILHLFRRPYWCRIWTFQELILARNLWLMCGLERIGFERNIAPLGVGRTALACTKILEYSSGLDWLPDIVGLVISRIHFGKLLRICMLRNLWSCPDELLSIRMDLDVLVIQTMELVATDPKDKVFGLLGLTESKFIPDYSKTAINVFRDFAEYYILQRRMEISIYADNNYDGNRANPVSPYQEYNACRGGIELAPMPQITSDFLCSLGILFDQIQTMEKESGAKFTMDFGFLPSIEGFLGQSHDYPSRITKMQAMLFITMAGTTGTTGNTRLHTTSKSFCGIAAGFIYNLLVLCNKEKPALNLAQDSSCLLGILGLKELNEDLESPKKFLDVFFRGPPMDKLLEVEKKLNIDTTNDVDLIERILRLGFTFRPSYALGKLEKLRNRRIFYTKKGYIGLYVPDISKDDIIAILQDCRVPLVLRKVDSHFTLISACYVPGIMDGEAVIEGKDPFLEIKIH